MNIALDIHCLVGDLVTPDLSFSATVIHQSSMILTVDIHAAQRIADPHCGDSMTFPYVPPFTQLDILICGIYEL